jgi:superfamily II DNA or RNA helicase
MLLKCWEKVIIFWTIQKIGVGVDIPFIDTIFLTSAIKFKATVIQAIGRWLRKYKDKKDVLVGIWNDMEIYKYQRPQKIKAIKEEYWINNFKSIKIK